MFKKKLLIGLSILTCALTSCFEPKPNGPLKPKTNEYQTYQEMVKAEGDFYKYYDDTAIFFFDISLPNMVDYEVKYYIDGICYCGLETPDAGYECSSTGNCPHLRNRDPFAEYLLKDGNVVTIMYKRFFSRNINSFNWLELKSEFDSKISYSYKLNNAEADLICEMKLQRKDDAIKKQFCDAIVKGVESSK